MRNAANPDAAREALSARLVALGKTHGLLLAGTKESASLDAVIRGTPAIHDDAQEGRLRVSGPFVHIGSRAALSLTLMIHERATNVAKYGAPSTPEGYVRVEWTIEDGGSEPFVRLRWQEADGPRVTPPSRKGFGSRLFERSLAGATGGEVPLDDLPGGVECELTAPSTGIEADD